MSYQTILYATDGPIATVTLNRPDELNTIVAPTPDESRTRSIWRCATRR